MTTTQIIACIVLVFGYAFAAWFGYHVYQIYKLRNAARKIIDDEKREWEEMLKSVKP